MCLQASNHCGGALRAWHSIKSRAHNKRVYRKGCHVGTEDFQIFATRPKCKAEKRDPVRPSCFLPIRRFRPFRPDH